MSIIERVQKLLALSKSDNPNEAAAAAALADKLIQKHQLTEAELQAASPNNANKPEPPDQYPYPIYTSLRRVAWKAHLASDIARHYDCAVIISFAYKGEKASGDSYRAANKESQYRIIGRKEDCELAVYMFDWIATEIERLAKKHASGRGYAFSQTYCEGAENGVMAKLRSEKEAFRAAAAAEGKGAAIVILDNKAVEARNKLAQLYPRLRTSAGLGGVRSKDAGAYSSGYSAGKSMNISRGIGGGGSSSGGLLGR
jgi:hypothetical protein